MGIKLESKFIKSKVKAKFGEFEVYNAIDKDIHSKLVEMIRENSQEIETEDNMSDVQINNTIKIVRFMMINLSNIEDSEYWNNIDDIELEEMLNLADGNFKEVVNTLMDVMLEVAQDIRLEDIRKLKIVKEKINELTEIFNFNSDIDEKLKSVGLDRELLTKIQSGDKEAIEEFQKKLLEKKNKQKRQYTKKTKK